MSKLNAMETSQHPEAELAALVNVLEMIAGVSAKMAAVARGKRID